MPSTWMFAEEELRSILRILDETSSYNAGWNYNPRSVILAVNALQPLGKEKALAAVAEFTHRLCEVDPTMTMDDLARRVTESFGL